MAVIICLDRHSSVREIALMVLMAYLSYMLAEVMVKIDAILEKKKLCSLQCIQVKSLTVLFSYW